MRTVSSRKFPLAAGRALTLEAEKTAGFIGVTARKENHAILGIQAVGSHVAELHGEFVLALRWAPFWKTSRAQCMPIPL